MAKDSKREREVSGTPAKPADQPRQIGRFPQYNFPTTGKMALPLPTKRGK
jgi:hypothetical protein